MNSLYIHAYPGQMLVFQILTDDGVVLTNESCEFSEVVRTTAKYLQKEDIKKIFVVGKTVFADKVADMINTNLDTPTLERI